MNIGTSGSTVRSTPSSRFQPDDPGRRPVSSACSTVQRQVDQPVRPLPNVADATHIPEELFFPDDFGALQPQARETLPAEPSHQDIAAPLGEGVARVEEHAADTD